MIFMQSTQLLLVLLQSAPYRVPSYSIAQHYELAVARTVQLACAALELFSILAPSSPAPPLLNYAASCRTIVLTSSCQKSFQPSLNIVFL